MIVPRTGGQRPTQHVPCRSWSQRVTAKIPRSRNERARGRYDEGVGLSSRRRVYDTGCASGGTRRRSHPALSAFVQRGPRAGAAPRGGGAPASPAYFKGELTAFRIKSSSDSLPPEVAAGACAFFGAAALATAGAVDLVTGRATPPP